MLMQEGLRRCNSIGDKNGVFHFAKLVLRPYVTEVDSVWSICSFANVVRISIQSSLEVFEFFNLIHVHGKRISATEDGIKLGEIDDIEPFSQALCKRCIAVMIDTNMIETSAIRYDELINRVYISKYGIPLGAAVFRNLLIEMGALSDSIDGQLYIERGYEKDFENEVVKNRKIMSILQLEKTLEQQRIQGRLAEEFVLSYENIRLTDHPQILEIKQISDIDVSAGYDIVSFNDTSSLRHDRFIEVKSYRGDMHFYWSENEFDVAKLKAENYYLYIVNVDEIANSEYKPEIISNPAAVISTNTEWLVETTSYRVTRISQY